MKLTNGVMIVVVSSSLFTAAQTIHVKGTVSDEMGAVISKATFGFRFNTFLASARPNQHRPSESQLETDKGGRFEADLVPRFYDVCVHSLTFTAEGKTLTVRKNRPAEISVILKPDPEIIAELGDDFGNGHLPRTSPVEPK